MHIYSFPPISTARSNVLILGTMPGIESLKQQEYYAHARNAFWKIMFALFDRPFSSNYSHKQSLLLENNIAVWDVLKACEREGSLDSNIREESPNELKAFLEVHNHVRHLFFNGKKAREYFLKYNKEIDLPFTVLPSTSPAHAIAFEKKAMQWEMVKHFAKD